MKDLELLLKIKKFLNCGKVVSSYNKKDNNYNIYVINRSDLFNIIIPFFDKYPLYGTKLINFNNFKKGNPNYEN
jgi:hypothetical protein